MKRLRPKLILFMLLIWGINTFAQKEANTARPFIIVPDIRDVFTRNKMADARSAQLIDNINHAFAKADRKMSSKSNPFLQHYPCHLEPYMSTHCPGPDLKKSGVSISDFSLSEIK